MLKTRVITGISLLVVLLLVLAYGGQLGWLLFVAAVLFASFWEWDRLSGSEGQQNYFYAAVGLGIFLGFWLLVGADPDKTVPMLALASVFWLVIAPRSVGQANVSWIDGYKFAYRLLGVLLVVSAGAALMMARGEGLVFLLSAVAICWAADIFAYVFGKLLGKRKLAPRVSPGKSWEGAIGGTATVLVLSWSVVLMADQVGFLQETWQARAASQTHPVLFTIWLIILSAYSIVGDLFESLLKRRAGMKDSSQLLPGHGGVLDRIDAQLPVLPLAMLFLLATK